MKRKFFAVMAMLAMLLPVQAQLSVRWGNVDTRYPVNAADAVSSAAVNEAVAWKGERVNFQLVVTNKGAAADSCTVKYMFSELKNGKSVIPATNVVGGFVQPVITDRFTGCGKHDVDAYGENLVADRITGTNPTVVDGGTVRGLWLTVQVPQDAKAGTYKGYVELDVNGKATKYSYTVKVLDRTLPSPAEWAFHLDLWQNPYAIARVHNVELWSKEHFDVLRPYMLKLASAGQKAITATLIDRPWDGQTFDPSALDIQVNCDELHSARSYDIILEVLVEDWAALDVYQQDMYHCNIVKKHMHAVAQSSIALDFVVNK